MMKFIDEEHKQFVLDKYKELKKYGKTDVYYKSIIYVLGICPMTRENFNKIFSIKEGIININSLEDAWQTGTSRKVTRMAFSLWNGCMYDSEENLEKKEKSSYYNVSEIFCCGYAPYFWEAIKIRYPEYTSQQKENNAVMYARVNNIHQLEYFVKEKIENNMQNKCVGLYMRTNATDDVAIEYSIHKKTKMLEQYCKENNIMNWIQYVDISKSGLSKNRKALQQMIKDIKAEKVNKIVITDASKLFRNPIEIGNLLLEDYMQNIEIISLDDSLIGFKNFVETLDKINHKAQITEDEETEEI